jgi:hypothetical protein
VRLRELPRKVGRSALNQRGCVVAYLIVEAEARVRGPLIAKNQVARNWPKCQHFSAATRLLPPDHRRNRPTVAAQPSFRLGSVLDCRYQRRRTCGRLRGSILAR